jgi:hypothetical protein
MGVRKGGRGLASRSSGGILMAIVTGTFSAPGTSDVFTPSPPKANSSFFVQLGGDFTGVVCHLMVSVGEGPMTPMCGPGQIPISLYYPGGLAVDVPYAAPGDAAPSYQLICTSLRSGECLWSFSQ